MTRKSLSNQWAVRFSQCTSWLLIVKRDFIMGLPNQYSLYIQSVALLFYLQSTVCNGRVIIKAAMAMNTKPVCDVTVATSIFYRCLEHKKARLWCGVDCFIKRAPVPFVDTFSKSQEVMYVMLALNSPAIHSPNLILSDYTTKVPQQASHVWPTDWLWRLLWF